MAQVMRRDFPQNQIRLISYVHIKISYYKLLKITYITSRFDGKSIKFQVMMDKTNRQTYFRVYNNKYNVEYKCETVLYYSKNFLNKFISDWILITCMRSISGICRNIYIFYFSGVPSWFKFERLKLETHLCVYNKL